MGVACACDDHHLQGSFLLLLSSSTGGRGGGDLSGILDPKPYACAVQALERKKQADEAFKESRRGGGVDRRKDPDGFDRKRRGFLIQGQRLEKESWALMAAAQQEVLKNIEVVLQAHTQGLERLFLPAVI